MLTDYHLHLRPDDLGTAATDYFTPANAERYREAASERGIEELGVSEHIHRFQQALGVWDHPFWRQSAVDDIDAYSQFVREHTDLRLGIEADFIPGREDRTANLLDSCDWDYVVGSVHFLADLAVDMEEYDVWKGLGGDPDRVWRRYFETLGEAARSGLFDILAHPDLVKVWGPQRPRPQGDLRRFYDLAMDGIAEARPAIEVSTAGLRKAAGEIYPAPEFLEMTLEAGCPVALSSDAHVPEHIGHAYDQAVAFLADLGVSELCVFERRERRLEPIGPA
jgi:histidinol-phosphatase (PHP family)